MSVGWAKNREECARLLVNQPAHRPSDDLIYPPDPRGSGFLLACEAALAQLECAGERCDPLNRLAILLRRQERCGIDPLEGCLIELVGSGGPATAASVTQPAELTFTDSTTVPSTASLRTLSG